MTPDQAAIRALVDGFRRALGALAYHPDWCACGHHLSAHPLTAQDARPCTAGPCECGQYEETRA